jgi:hypothetical protein
MTEPAQTERAPADPTVPRRRQSLSPVEKFCKGIEPGRGRVARCLAEHQDALSEACRQRIAQAKEEFEAKHPCHADAKKLCQGVKPGEGRIAACLEQHESEVSGACKDHLAHKGAGQN